MSDRDEPGPLRPADAFDVAAAHAWLRSEVSDLPDALPGVHQVTGGASNLTYLLRYPDRELILRRPPAGAKPSSGRDVRRLSERVVDRWLQLHAVDPVATGLAAFGRGPGYVERQVNGWSARYRAARTRNVPSLERVMSWLEANRPDDDRTMRMLRRQPTEAPGMLTRREVVDRDLAATGRTLSAEAWRFFEVYGLSDSRSSSSRSTPGTWRAPPATRRSGGSGSASTSCTAGARV